MKTSVPAMLALEVYKLILKAQAGDLNVTFHDLAEQSRVTWKVNCLTAIKTENHLVTWNKAKAKPKKKKKAFTVSQEWAGNTVAGAGYVQ